MNSSLNRYTQYSLLVIDVLLAISLLVTRNTGYLRFQKGRWIDHRTPRYHLEQLTCNRLWKIKIVSLALLLLSSIKPVIKAGYENQQLSDKCSYTKSKYSPKNLCTVFSNSANFFNQASHKSRFMKTNSCLTNAVTQNQSALPETCMAGVCFGSMMTLHFFIVLIASAKLN